MQGIELLEGDVWGHRKDINEYYEIKPRIFDRIEELKKRATSPVCAVIKRQSLLSFSTIFPYQRFFESALK